MPSLEALLASRHDVVAVVTRPDAPAGRGRTLRPSPVRERAEAAGLEVELLAGGYDLEPLGPHDDRAIVIARMPGSGGPD